MPNSLSARPELRMTLLPGESVSESRRGARSSVAIRSHAASRVATRAVTDPEPAARHAVEGPDARDAGRHEDDAVHYENAGPDCYWLEAG
jgi:hypothetical protein